MKNGKESSTDLAARLKAEGRWKDFLLKREQYEREGLAKRGAYRKAQMEFQPLNTVPAVNNPIQKSEPVQAAPEPTPQPQLACALLTEIKRTRDMRAVVAWVFDNMDVEHPDQETCPSSGAWSLLNECRRSPGLKYDFYTNIMPKLLPSRASQEDQDRLQDDGRNVLDILSRVSQAAAEAAGESNVELSPSV